MYIGMECVCSYYAIVTYPMDGFRFVFGSVYGDEKYLFFPTEMPLIPQQFSPFYK